MDDKAFITQLNTIAAQAGLQLRLLGRDESPDSEFISDWAKFLELCVKKGIPLSDPRWQTLRVEEGAKRPRFAIETSGKQTRSDADFRVGLQLLMGMLEGKDESDI